LRGLRSYSLLFWVAVVVVALDQVSKYEVAHRYGVGYGPRNIIDHLVMLTVTENRGAAFGLFQTFTLGFLLVSLVVLVGILVFYPRLSRRDWTARLALALVFGGAISNAYDRGVHGTVIDFIQVPHWPIFNVADSAISVGVALLVIGALFRVRAAPRH
jgi:signal peptidase II